MLTSSTLDLNWAAPSSHGLQRNKIFQSIVFPIDFSNDCKTIAPYVRGLAELTGGSVTLLHVIPWRSAWYGAADVYSGSDDSRTLRGLKRILMSALARFRDECFSGVQCQIRIESGCVAEHIVDYAEHTGADLIMMTTRGTGKSVTATVLQDALCAVWTSPHCDKMRPFTGFRSILCAIAPNTAVGEFVDQTSALGAAFGGRVSFITAIATPDALGENGPVLSAEKEYPLAGPAQLLVGSGCPVYVETGPVGYVLRRVAELESSDLVVLPRHRVPQGFETHAYDIVLESPCPVLTLPIGATATSINIVREATQGRYACARASY
jgi:nucleotide-binding universal stress UspA family protein